MADAEDIADAGIRKWLARAAFQRLRRLTVGGGRAIDFVEQHAPLGLGRVSVHLADSLLIE
jgi:hypothetical protein